MIRRIVAPLAILSFLSACGGGGGGSPAAAVIPKTPSKTSGTATFMFKLPGKATMTKVRRPYYVSQATAGVGIDWSSTNPTMPNYAAALSATCPGTLPAGVTACSIDAQGDTDYTFSLQIPAGSYTFTVSTFDAAPVSGAFPSGNMLAQGQLAAPITITAGQNNTISGLTFYGVPASVSFVPAPSQSHVLNYAAGAGASNSYAVIGNAPQTFYAQAVDADGFAIASSDSGAPAISVAETTPDICTTSAVAKPCFTVTSGSAPYSWVLQAQSAAGTYANINVTATPGGGLQAINTPYTVAAAQELWTTQSSGGSASDYGISGYALLPGPLPTPAPEIQPSGPIDYSNPQLCGGQCNWSYAAMDPSGNIWAIAESYGIYEFKQGSASQGVVAPTAASAIPLGPSPQAMTIDGNGYLYLVDSNACTISIYDTKAPSATPLTVITDSNGIPASIAVAPANAGAIAGAILVGDSVGITVYAPYGGGATAPAQAGQITNGIGYPEALSFDPTGAFWMYDELDALVEVGSATATSVSFVATTAPQQYDGAEQLGVTAQQVAFMGGPASLNGLAYYGYSGGSFSNIGTNYNFSSTWSVMIAP